ncbi:hypothetical protein CU098_011840 [Rhizopus stolonifer]|uniref:Sialate O-acetylesterase domain-containing protein n=1 Tax=Rhizopus stolonifer TaxID=4846 RepID=A0A367KIF9_RHIST|nr:hypothetical protein CU098_011840 [Rhizopus stolonifer]
MAGQSNMRGHGYYRDPFTGHELCKEPQPHVFLYDSSERWRPFDRDPSHQLHQSPRSVHHTLPDPTVRDPHLLETRGASLAVGFANMYRAIMPDVPLGLIASAHGGTSLSDWQRPAELNTQTADTTLYGAMWDRIQQVHSVAGILWYQGESDTSNKQDADTYLDRFQHWLSTLRADLEQPNLPLVFVQIGPHRVNVPAMMEHWKTVQDAQFQLMGSCPFTAGVASLDVDLDDRLHLSACGLSSVGKRLAIAAHKAKQGQGHQATPLPDKAYLETTPSGHTSIVVEFKYLHKPWHLKAYEQVFGFSIESSKIALLKTIVCDDSKGSVRLYLSDKPDTPFTICYGMHQSMVNLVTLDGMALPAFKLKVY